MFAKLWMNSLLGHLKRLDKMVVLTNSALHDWPELDNVVKIPDTLPFKIDGDSCELIFVDYYLPKQFHAAYQLDSVQKIFPQATVKS